MVKKEIIKVAEDAKKECKLLLDQLEALKGEIFIAKAQKDYEQAEAMLADMKAIAPKYAIAISDYNQALLALEDAVQKHNEEKAKKAAQKVVNANIGGSTGAKRNLALYAYFFCKRFL